APSARAANDHVVVAGLGAGIHTFDKADDVRSDPFMKDIDDGITTFIGAEWYFLGDLGLGLRDTTILSGRLGEEGGLRKTDTVEFNTFMLTINYMPLVIMDGYTRMGVLAGHGKATYKRTINYIIEESFEAAGSATMKGIYLDWGGDEFGARLGYNTLNTKLGRINMGGGSRLDVDISGSHWYFTLRMAFGPNTSFQ
ncbi:MAG: hypothetical protein OEZ59_11530, partial [Deltaproteobacteria bacterium]|nr:hypothetical protein [Deltaproteobacteria bacterium]